MDEKIPEWTGALVGRMHVARISKQDLAEELGYTRQYISMILYGKTCPRGAEEKFFAALERIERRRARNGVE